LPHAYHIATQVKASGLTSQLLAPEHIEELLETLIMDGAIERLRVRREEGEYDDAETVREKKAAEKKRKRAAEERIRKRKKAKKEDGNASDTIDHDSLDDFIVEDE